LYRLALFVALIAIVAVSAQKQNPSWAEHNSGHELLVTLMNEKDLTFVMIWFKDMLNNPRQMDVNDRARRELEALLTANHSGVVFTEVDMSNSNRNAYTYERLGTKQLGINHKELEYGPVAVILKNGVGHQVVFKGNYNDFMETVDRTLHQVNPSNQSEEERATARAQALEVAKQKQSNKSNRNFDYYRPSQYDPHEFQTQDRLGYLNDPSVNESPVAQRSGN
jgi:hypothetical protein